MAPAPLRRRPGKKQGQGSADRFGIGIVAIPKHPDPPFQHLGSSKPGLHHGQTLFDVFLSETQFQGHGDRGQGVEPVEIPSQAQFHAPGSEKQSLAPAAEILIPGLLNVPN